MHSPVANESTGGSQARSHGVGAPSAVSKALLHRDPSRNFWVSFDAPVRSDIRWVSALSSLEMSVHWAQGEQGEDSIVGLGEGLTFRGEGTERFATVGAALASLTTELVNASGELSERVRAFGGFSFDVQKGTPSDAPWTSFGEARFVVPRWTYRVRKEVNSACATVSLFLPASAEVKASTLDKEWSELTGALASTVQKSAQSPELVSTEPGNRARWYDVVEGALSEFREGSMKKVVAARCSRFELSSAADQVDVIERLATRFPTCRRYCFTFDGVTFVGATPEKLIQKVGNHADTEALAGTCDAKEVSVLSLLESDKDRHEHVLVSDAIVEALGPFSKRVERDAAPKLKALHNVVHIHTGIRAELEPGVSVLDLVGALHPTPAVGGVPREAAMKWIRQQEEHRGWYASPIGVVDETGDGEFYVALRCALLSETKAWAWAGAGLVNGSTKEQEYDETELKMAAILNAIGVVA